MLAPHSRRAGLDKVVAEVPRSASIATQTTETMVLPNGAPQLALVDLSQMLNRIASLEGAFQRIQLNGVETATELGILKDQVAEVRRGTDASVSRGIESVASKLVGMQERAFAEVVQVTKGNESNFDKVWKQVCALSESFESACRTIGDLGGRTAAVEKQLNAMREGYDKLNDSHRDIVERVCETEDTVIDALANLGSSSAGCDGPVSGSPPVMLGHEVLLHGLQAAELNGICGHVIDVRDVGRVGVRLATGREVAVRRENLSTTARGARARRPMGPPACSSRMHT